MKLSTVLALTLTLPIAVESSRFFGISRGGKSKSKTVPSPTISKDDYEVAERELFKAIGTLEGKMQHVIEKEVDTLFHGLEHHEKRDIIDRANKAVKKGVNKVKKQVEDHDHDKEKGLPLLDYMTHYPYSWPEDDPGHQILHSIESAEKAVVHAVDDEVNNFFHGSGKHHDDHDEVKKAHKVLKEGIEKTIKQRDEAHEHRRHQILHSIDSAEKAVVHAVDDEVNNVFHGFGKHHDDHDKVKKAHKVLKRGLEKTTKHLDEAHEHRREWFKDGNLIEEYTQLNFL